MAVPQFSSIKYKKDPKRIRTDICSLTIINQETPNDWLGYVKCRGGIIEEHLTHIECATEWVSECEWGAQLSMNCALWSKSCATATEHKLCYGYRALGAFLALVIHQWASPHLTVHHWSRRALAFINCPCLLVAIIIKCPQCATSVATISVTSVVLKR